MCASSTDCIPGKMIASPNTPNLQNRASLETLVLILSKQMGDVTDYTGPSHVGGLCFSWDDKITDSLALIHQKLMPTSRWVGADKSVSTTLIGKRDNRLFNKEAHSGRSE